MTHKQCAQESVTEDYLDGLLAELEDSPTNAPADSAEDEDSSNESSSESDGSSKSEDEAQEAGSEAAGSASSEAAESSDSSSSDSEPEADTNKEGDANKLAVVPAGAVEDRSGGSLALVAQSAGESTQKANSNVMNSTSRAGTVGMG